jgi:DNA-binding transcriptional ArsR family regulator
VGLIADLLKEIPAAAKFKLGLDAMETENERLKAENAELQEELEHYTQKWVTLDEGALKTLMYLSQYERGHAGEIAEAYELNIQIVEMYLNVLVEGDYVRAPLNGEKPHYGLARKGRRYLHERGLLKSP